MRVPIGAPIDDFAVRVFLNCAGPCARKRFSDRGVPIHITGAVGNDERHCRYLLVAS